MTANTDMFRQIIAIWNLPVSERPAPDRDLDFYINPRVDPVDVFRELNCKFASEEIGRQISDFLFAQSRTLPLGVIPSRRDLFLIECCLMVASRVDAVPISKAIVMTIVKTFDSSMFYSSVRPLITARITDVELLNALGEAISESNGSNLQIAAIEGLRLYTLAASPDSDRIARKDAIEKTKSVLQSLVASPDFELRRKAIDGLNYLVSYDS